MSTSTTVDIVSKLAADGINVVSTNTCKYTHVTCEPDPDQEPDQTTTPATYDILTDVPRRISCLDHGFVELIDCMPRMCPFGYDASYVIVKSARVSTGSGTKDPKTDAGLIRRLMRDRHTSPFESCEVQFCIRAPIFVKNQIFRTRTANVNEQSQRYSKVPDDFYHPTGTSYAGESQFGVRTQDKKNMQMSNFTNVTPDLLHAFEHAEDMMYACYQAYERCLEHGGARETSRCVLPLSIYTTFFFKLDLHNLFHFFRLRLAPDAQWETRVFAQAMYDLIRPVFRTAFEAYERYNVNSITFYDYEVKAFQKITTDHVPSAEELGMNKTEYELFKDKIERLNGTGN